MPPEQVRGAQANARSNLYSLGATIYEMVAGRPPFIGDNFEAVIAQQLTAHPDPPSAYNAEVPRTLDKFVLTLLSKNREQRPATAAIVRGELGRSREGLLGKRRDAVDEILKTVVIQHPELNAADDGTIVVFFLGHRKLHPDAQVLLR
jgi:serine/threonine protein kinase